jgi:hypothetical protein
VDRDPSPYPTDSAQGVLQASDFVQEKLIVHGDLAQLLMKSGDLLIFSITKAGDCLARKALVESAWSYRMSAKVSRDLHKR